VKNVNKAKKDLQDATNDEERNKARNELTDAENQIAWAEKYRQEQLKALEDAVAAGNKKKNKEPKKATKGHGLPSNDDTPTHSDSKVEDPCTKPCECSSDSCPDPKKPKCVSCKRETPPPRGKNRPDPSDPDGGGGGETEPPAAPPKTPGSSAEATGAEKKPDHAEMRVPDAPEEKKGSKKPGDTEKPPPRKRTPKPAKDLTESDYRNLAAVLLGTLLPEDLAEAFGLDHESFGALLSDDHVRSALHAILRRNEAIEDLADEIAYDKELGLAATDPAVVGAFRGMTRLQLLQERDALEVLWRASQHPPSGYSGERAGSSAVADPNAARSQIAQRIGALLGQAQALDDADRSAFYDAVAHSGRIGDLPSSSIWVNAAELNTHKAALMATSDAGFRTIVREIVKDDNLRPIADAAAKSARGLSPGIQNDPSPTSVLSETYSHLDRERSLAEMVGSASWSTFVSTSSHFMDNLITPFVSAYDALNRPGGSLGEAGLKSAWAPINAALTIAFFPLAVLEATKQTLSNATAGTGAFEGYGRTTGGWDSGLSKTVLTAATIIEIAAFAEQVLKGTVQGFGKRAAEVSTEANVQAGERAAAPGVITLRPGDAADTSALLDIVAREPRPFRNLTAAAFEGGEIGVPPRALAQLKRSEDVVRAGLREVGAETRLLPEGSAENVAKLAKRMSQSDAEIAASAYERVKATGGRFITGDEIQGKGVFEEFKLPKEQIHSVRPNWSSQNWALLLSLGGLGTAYGFAQMPIVPEHQ